MTEEKKEKTPEVNPTKDYTEGAAEATLSDISEAIKSLETSQYGQEVALASQATMLRAQANRKLSTQSNVVPFQHEHTSEDAPTEGPELNEYIARHRPDYVAPPTREQVELAYLIKVLGKALGNTGGAVQSSPGSTEIEDLKKRVSELEAKLKTPEAKAAPTSAQKK